MVQQSIHHPALRQGIAFAQAGEILAAHEMFQRALEQNPRNVDAWLWLGRLFDTPGKRRFCYQRALSLAPGNPEALAALAEIDGLIPIVSLCPVEAAEKLAAPMVLVEDRAGENSPEIRKTCAACPTCGAPVRQGRAFCQHCGRQW